MTRDELAATLNGREIGNEMDRDEEAQAKADGLIVIYGASDDLCEIRGVVNDEFGCDGGGEFRLSRTGVASIDGSYKDEEEVTLNMMRERIAQFDASVVVEAIWCPAPTTPGQPAPSWAYKTDVPHETFRIIEDGEPYCNGMVISASDLP